MPATILTQQQQKVLELLAPIVCEQQFYLAGGTALALMIQHRRSLDFDFFTAHSFNPSAILSRLPYGEIRQQTRGTLTVGLDSIQTSFFEYPYPLLQPVNEEGIVPLAQMPDIAAMKISAIAGRGSRKDFIDLYYIIQRGYSFQQCLSFFSEKFKTIKVDIYHLMRSLTYFDDAESEVMPEMLTECNWETIKRFFISEATKLQE